MGSSVRPPWVSSTTDAVSYSALLFHAAGAVIVLRLLVGAGFVWGGLDWHPGELDGVSAAAVLAALGGIYRWRPASPGPGTTTTVSASTTTVEEGP